MRAADIGCGHGLYSRALSSLGAVTIGADLSHVVYALAAESHEHGNNQSLHFIRADGQRLPLKEGEFDIVLLMGMAHHTQNPEIPILEASRLVARGGRFLLYLYEPWAVGYVTLRKLFPFLRFLPRKALHQVCRLLAVPVSLHSSLKASKMPSKQLLHNAELGLFDALSPRYVHTLKQDKIRHVLQNAGFASIVRLEKCMYLAIRD
jgi:SAM-dependent methyltransferase